jgi:Family of unknown function (DUF6345)
MPGLLSKRVSAAAIMGTFVFGAALAIPRASFADEEASLYVMTNWPGPPICDCDPRNEKDEWDDMLYWWLWYMDYPYSPGNWAEDQYYVDSPIVEGWFTDEMVDTANGNDDLYLDDADAAMSGGHGARVNLGGSLYWDGYQRERDWTGQTETCHLMSHEMLLGGSDDSHDLEFLHLSSCHSLEYDSSVTNDMWETWKGAFTSTTHEAGLHQLEGFHGHMTIHDYLWVDYFRVVQDGLVGSVAEAWVEHLYIWGSPGDNICPVSMVAGPNGQSATFRLAHESYNSGYSDPDDSPGFARLWVGRCKPIDAEALPGLL